MSAQLRPDLAAAIELRFPDNLTGDITPADVRAFLHDLLDSVLLADALPASPVATKLEVQALSDALSFPYTALTIGPTTTWDVLGLRHGAASLNLTASTTLALANAANGFVGALCVINVSNGPLNLALPAGCYGPKNYNLTLAADEVRLFGVTKTHGPLCVNSEIYYPQ